MKEARQEEDAGAGLDYPGSVLQPRSSATMALAEREERDMRNDPITWCERLIMGAVTAGVLAAILGVPALAFWAIRELDGIALWTFCGALALALGVAWTFVPGMPRTFQRHCVVSKDRQTS